MLRVLQAVFVVAFVVLIAVQMALMSILDGDRAEHAARVVAESDHAADLVDDAVRSAVVPLAGEDVGTQIATLARSDPRVAEVIRLGLLDAHRSIVEPNAIVTTGSSEMQAVIADVIEDAEAQTGLDLVGLDDRLDVPQVDPRYVPDVGARRIAERARAVAGIVALAAAAIGVITHPRPGRALASMGVLAAIVCGAWAVVLLAVGWLIGALTDTLFGQMVDAIWSATMPSMLLLVVAGAALGAGSALAGLALDGMTRSSGLRRP